MQVYVVIQDIVVLCVAYDKREWAIIITLLSCAVTNITLFCVVCNKREGAVILTLLSCAVASKRCN